MQRQGHIPQPVAAKGWNLSGFAVQKYQIFLDLLKILKIKMVWCFLKKKIQGFKGPQCSTQDLDGFSHWVSLSHIGSMLNLPFTGIILSCSGNCGFSALGPSGDSLLPALVTARDSQRLAAWEATLRYHPRLGWKSQATSKEWDGLLQKQQNLGCLGLFGF